VNPNKRRATLHGLILGTALRDGLFFRPAALLLTYVQKAHDAINALQNRKNTLIAAPVFCVCRPDPMQTRPLRFRYRTSLTGPLLGAILLVSATACQQQPSASAPTIPSSPAAATIGGTAIYEADIDSAIQALPETLQVQRNNPELRSRVLHVLLRREALSQQAIDLHLDEDPLIHHRIIKARDDILIESLQRWKIRRIPEPDEATIAAYYQAHLSEFTIPEQAHARHILLGSKKQADNVRKALRRGKDFAALAAEFSRDDGTKSLGGDLNWFPRGVMDNVFEDVVFALKNPGDISVPVKTPFGWHIIELIGKRPASRQSLIEAKGDIAAMLKQQAMSAWVDSLTKSAGAQILNMQYNRLPGEQAP